MTVAAPPERAGARVAGTGLVVTSFCLAVVGAGVAAAALGESLPLLLVATAILAILWFGPIWVFAPLVLVATILSDVVRLEMGTSATADLFGQGRIILLIAAVVLLRLLLERQSLPLPRRAFVPVALYLTSLFFMAVVASAAGVLDFAALQRSMSYVLAFGVGIAAVTRPAHRVPAIRAMAVVTILAGISALLYWGWIGEVVTQPAALTEFFARVRQDAAAASLDPTRSRLPWVDHHPNRVGVMFTLLAAFVVPPLLASRRGFDSLLALLTVIAATGGVLATQSRTGIVVLGVAALGLAILWLTRRPGESNGRLFLILAITIPLGLMAYQWIPQDRGFSRDDENLQSRQAIWADALDTFGDAPWLGHGLDYAAGPNFWGGLSAHNEYLGQLVDGGLIGGLVFAVLLASFVGIGWRVSRRPGTDGAFGLGMLTFMGVLAVSMFVGTTWRTAGPAVISWLCFGMVTAVLARPSDEAAPQDHLAPGPAQLLHTNGEDGVEPQ